MRTQVIYARQLFDGYNWQRYSGGVAVAFSEGKLIYVGPASNAPQYDCEITTLPDDTLLPGLIDMHVHMTMDGTAHTIDQTQSDSSSMAMLRATINAERLIERGITTVRDCGCQGDQAICLGQAVKDGLIRRSPKILACGQALCITGGHGTFIGHECDGQDDARRSARRMIKNGANFLKLISTGGVISKGTQTGAVQLNPDEVEAIVSEAKKVGIPTATHAHGTEGIKIALRAGVDTIEHASYVDEEGIELFLQTGAMFTSTLLASQLELDHADELPDYMAEKIRNHMNREHASVSKLIAAGVPALGGTDAGTPFNPHGALVDQLIMLKEHGLSHLGTLQASTTLAAKALNKENEIGALSVGLSADIVAVHGNLEDDLNALRNICCVWRDGNLLVNND